MSQPPSKFVVVAALQLLQNIILPTELRVLRLDRGPSCAPTAAPSSCAADTAATQVPSAAAEMLSRLVTATTDQEADTRAACTSCTSDTEVAALNLC